MAEKFQTFDLWNPVAEDFNFETLARVNELRRRWIDQHTWGVVRNNSYPVVVNIPVSAINLVPNRKWNVGQFTIKLDVISGTLNIGEGSSQAVTPGLIGGVAYDINGERIAILEDEVFDFSNDVAWGKKNSGNLGIPLTVASAGPSVPGTYYIWIEYLEINQNISTVGEDGAIHYPKIMDGYRILMTATPVAPSGDGVSLFLAKVTWLGGAAPLIVDDLDGVTSATDGSNTIDTAPITAGDPKRIYSAVRDNVIEIVVDETKKTVVYASGMLGNLRNHVNAMGGGSPTPNNPHALTLADIPGAGEEPVATNNQNDSFDKGIVDKNAAQNSPVWSGDALRPFIEVTGLTPTTLDPTATSAGITSTPKVQWIRIRDLDQDAKVKAAFVLGFRLVSVYPTLQQTSDHSAPAAAPLSVNDGWVGFNNAEDTDGVYRIYGTKDTLSDGTDVLLLNKELIPGWPSAIPALDDGQLLLGQVYWDGVTVFRNKVEPSTADPVASQPDDQRSLGLVGPQQISTEAKSDPVIGALAGQVFEQQVANSAYAFMPSANVTEVDFSTGKVINVAAAVTAGTDGSIATPPVAAITGRKWTTNTGVAGSLGTSKVFHLLKNAKPGKFYGISFYYKADAGFNVRLRVGISDANTSVPSSLITVDGVASVDPLDITILNDNNWHRASLVVQVLPSVNPDPAVLKYLEFLFQQGGLTTTLGAFSMTNIQVTEGEWIPGYMGSKYVPSGGIIMWDLSTSCPPGFQEITAARGRMPVGVNPAGSNGIQTPATPLGGQISNGTAQIGLPAHQHSGITGSSSGGEDSGTNANDLTKDIHSHAFTTYLDGAATLNLGLYPLLLCRAI